MRVFRRVGLSWLAVCLVAAAAAASDRGRSVQRVAFGELFEAMRAEQGCDARKTTNLARFQAGVFLQVDRPRGA